MTADEMATAIQRECEGLKAFLLKKQAAYGNSAADPVRIFSRSGATEQLNVRIDDKLSRISRGQEHPGDNTELDLIGYLILRRILAVRELTK